MRQEKQRTVTVFTQINGLITRETRYKENDKLLTIVTAERGVLTARAKGVMRMRSPLASACQLYAYADFTLFENKGHITVNAAEPLELFLGLRNDAVKLALAAYLADITERLAAADVGDSELLRLTLNCFFALSATDHPAELVRAAFEMRAAQIGGYEPQLDACIHCGETPTHPYISPVGGGICCQNCITAEDGNVFPCQPQVLPLLAYFLTAPIRKLLPSGCDVRLAEDAAYVTERYLFSQLDCDPRLLRFYKSLRSF